MGSICPRCLNEFDSNDSRFSFRDNETRICCSCSDEETRVNAGSVKLDEIDTVYERELRMQTLCFGGSFCLTEEGAVLLQEGFIRKVITEVIIPQIKKIHE